MPEETPRPRRPALRANLAALLAEDGSSATLTRAELASATAAALVSAGRGEAFEDTDRFVNLADDIGIDTLAELWRDAEPGTLAGALWAVYLLRTWCRTDTELVLRLWRAGRPYAPADEVVAGVSEMADPQAISAMTDDLLNGAYRGDFAVALERAAAFFRVVAMGRRQLARDGAPGMEDLERAVRNDRAADGLADAALRWRAGILA